MRRFDKLKVIKEANQILEEKFLVNKSVILEQDSNDGTPDTSTPDTGTPDTGTPEKNNSDGKSNPADDFNELKKEFRLTGDNKKAKGFILGSTDKKIEITSDGRYNITNKDGEKLQSGQFKNVGIWPAKHIEFKPDNTKDFLKMKNILSKLSITTSEPQGFHTGFMEMVKVPKNLRPGANKSSIYNFYYNKNRNINYSIWIYPEDEGETGTFKIAFKKADGTNMWLTNGEGDFEDYGKIFNLENPSKSVSVDKNGKIDSGLIQLLSLVYPDYAD